MNSFALVAELADSNPPSLQPQRFRMADPPRNDEPSRRMGQQGQVEEQAEEDLVDSPTVATTITVWQPSAVVYNSYPSNTGFPTHRYATSAPATAVVAVPRGFTLQGTQFQLGSVNTDRLAANNALQVSLLVPNK